MTQRAGHRSGLRRCRAALRREEAAGSCPCACGCSVLVSVFIQLAFTTLRFTSFSLALLRALKQQPDQGRAATRACARAAPGEEATPARLKMAAATRVLHKIYMVRCGVIMVAVVVAEIRRRTVSAKAALFRQAVLAVLVSVPAFLSEFLSAFLFACLQAASEIPFFG